MVRNMIKHKIGDGTNTYIWHTIQGSYKKRCLYIQSKVKGHNKGSNDKRI